jgi:uncharacterized protein (DUF2062 family)/SAM-dependent methyltransferase
MEYATQLPRKRRSLALYLRRLAQTIRTEGGGPGRESVALGLGVFIGCLPLYGFHLLICMAAGTLFRLNRLKVYLAANISNPFVAPWLLLLEVEAGAFLRHGAFHPLSLETIKSVELASVTLDLVVGAVAVGAALGGLVGGITYALVRGTDEHDAFATVVRLAADRYIDAGVTAWEFARGKLRGDPIYRALVCDDLLARPLSGPAVPGHDERRAAPAGTLVDIGCGMGLSLALLAETRRASLAGTWPMALPVPPAFEHIVGIEIRRRVAAMAAAALADDAVVITGDARASLPGRFHVVLLFDVLHMMGRDEQEALIASLAANLEPEGRILVREADAAAGWRFTAVRWGNRLKALTRGSWRQQFCFRTAPEWAACFASHGLHSEMRRMSEGTLFGNVLFVVTPDRPRSGA